MRYTVISNRESGSNRFMFLAIDRYDNVYPVDSRGLGLTCEHILHYLGLKHPKYGTSPIEHFESTRPISELLLMNKFFETTTVECENAYGFHFISEGVDLNTFDKLLRALSKEKHIRFVNEYSIEIDETKPLPEPVRPYYVIKLEDGYLNDFGEEYFTIGHIYDAYRFTTEDELLDYVSKKDLFNGFEVEEINHTKWVALPDEVS